MSASFTEALRDIETIWQEPIDYVERRTSKGYDVVVLPACRLARLRPGSWVAVGIEDGINQDDLSKITLSMRALFIAEPRTTP